jgi:hypothetical protein
MPPVFVSTVSQRRGVRVVEGARLEIVCMSNRCTEGSNPSLSANLYTMVVGVGPLATFSL